MGSKLYNTSIIMITLYVNREPVNQAALVLRPMEV